VKLHITADKREIRDFLKLPSATSFIREPLNESWKKIIRKFMKEKEEFLKNEKVRIGKLYSTRHRKGFSNKDEFVKWFENTIKSQNFKCYYCDTSIFNIRSLIDTS